MVAQAASQTRNRACAYARIVLETLPARWYWDPAVHDRERQAVFAREWQYVGAAERLERSGSYITADIAGWSIVVVSDKDGVRRAFHNVCGHRAGPLVTDEAGMCAGGLVCRYHGWTYSLDGRLRNARDFGIDPGETSLHPVAVDEWRGLLFVNLSPSPPPLEGWLGGFAAEAASFEMERFRLTHDCSHVVHANWKTYADNYGEGYHLPLVHPELSRQVDFRRYRVDAHDTWCLHSAPAADGGLTIGRWLWRFPNLALNLYPDGMNIERFTPLSPTTTRVDYSFFFRDGVHDDATVKLSEAVLAEDVAICEAVQRNLQAGVYDVGVLSPRHENGLALLHRLVRDAVSR